MELIPLQSEKSFNLYAIVVQIAAINKGYLPASLGRAIHAQVLHWLQMGDPNASEYVHNSQDSPISLSGLIGHRRASGIRSGDEFYFRIGLLNGSLIEPLLNGIEQWGSEPLTLTQFPFIIKGIHSLPGTHPWVGSGDYQMLSKLPKNSDDITLEFMTPTSFKQQKYVQLFPSPELVFSSLMKRWNAFAPEEQKLEAIAWQGFVSAYSLETHTLKMENNVEIGAKGWIKYRFPDPQEAKIANILAHFAFFSAIGRKTALGMGQTRISHQSSVNS